MLDLSTQAKNDVTIVGKIMEVSFRTGKTAQGKPYESANYTVRVTNHFNGHTEISEIPCSTFASKFTNTGKPNPVYNTIEALHEMKTIQTNGEGEADTRRLAFAPLGDAELYLFPQGDDAAGAQSGDEQELPVRRAGGHLCGRQLFEYAELQVQLAATDEHRVL